jgi:AAA domain-containing protein/bifunctional DNA primase/polymerase-like protein
MPAPFSEGQMADSATAATAASVFDQFSPLYTAAGYRTVPIAPNTKYPGIHTGFGNYVALAQWTTREQITEPQPNAGIGMICGDPLVAADIDTDDEALGIEVIDALVTSRGVVVTKIGKRGQTLLLRPPSGTTVKSRKFLIDGKVVFEMLAEGRQTVLPPTEHPDLKAPYRWGNDATPLNTALGDMAVLREDWEARVEEVLSKRGYQPELTEPARPFDDKSPFQQINTLALDNLPEWVPALGLYKCRRGRGYPNYEAVALWRPSTSGRPAEQREPNLKISKRGIKDFGTGKGYSSLDLVMAARGCSLDEAFDWLNDQLSERIVVDITKERPATTLSAAVTAEAAKTQEPPKIRFKLVPFGDMRPGLEPLYLVDELIPVAGLVDIWGKPKCFKSFWTLDVAFHVAMGWEYRDRSVHQGAVVYCAFEGAHGYKKRIEAIRRHYGLLEDDQVPLYIMPGQANLITDHKTLIHDISFQLDETKPVLVVLDTLNKSLMGSESKDTDMSAYVRAAEAIRDAFKCVVVIVHHCGLDDTRPRGHTSLPGAVDAQLAVVRDDNYVTVEVEMMRDGPEETIVTSVVEPVDVGQDSAGKMLTSLVVKPSETPVGGQMGARWTGSLTKFREALSEALIHSDLKVTINGHPIRAADREEVRKEFYRICMVDGDTAEQKQDTRKKRFARAAERAQELHLIGVRVEPWGQELMWMTAPGAEPQHPSPSYLGED